MTAALLAVLAVRALAAGSLEIVDVYRAVKEPRRREDESVCWTTDARLAARLWKVHAAVFNPKGWVNFGPDSAYRQVRLTHEGRTLTLQSWHPLVERPGVVAASYGVTALPPETTREDFLKKDKREYAARREAFDAIVEACPGRR